MMTVGQPNTPLTCDDCGEAKPDVRLTNCPYCADIHNNPDVSAMLCDDCFQERCNDI
jgi:hypothetical protein